MTEIAGNATQLVKSNQLLRQIAGVFIFLPCILPEEPRPPTLGTTSSRRDTGNTGRSNNKVDNSQMSYDGTETEGLTEFALQLQECVRLRKEIRDAEE